MDHEFADALDRLTPLRQHGREDVPGMNHVGPDLELDLDTFLAGGLGDAKAVIEQSFRGADLDQERWEALHLGVNR